MQIFLDCDGVLADFDLAAHELFGMPSREYEKEYGAGSFWKTIAKTDSFFYKLKPMIDADELVEGVLARGHTPIILTGIPMGGWAVEQKLKWRDKHYPDIEMITCRSRDKYQHMVDDMHNIIIDDWPQHKQVWEDAGGTFILHTSTRTSLEELDEVLSK